MLAEPDGILIKIVGGESSAIFSSLKTLRFLKLVNAPVKFVKSVVGTQLGNLVVQFPF